MDIGTLTGILFFIAGLVLGSFGNVLICRLPVGKRIGGRSECPHCSQVLKAYDLLPVFSYIFLRGKCRKCDACISLQYPIIELASGVLFFLAYNYTSIVLTGCMLAIALWLLLLIAAIDFSTQGIPDILNIPFIVSSVLYGLLVQQLDPISFGLCTGFLGLQWLCSRGKWVGSGDVLLSIGISALLGRWESILLMLGIAYISGSVLAVYLIAKHGSTTEDHIAFAPFLGLGTLIALFAGEWILRALFYV
jgi:leader peptidase (prepilin peptidase) / N-methyltransferase